VPPTPAHTQHGSGVSFRRFESFFYTFNAHSEADYLPLLFLMPFLFVTDAARLADVNIKHTCKEQLVGHTRG
jgi:hypothetical protein